MIEINNKRLCESCFREIYASPCRHCGYSPDSTDLPSRILPPGTVLADKYIIGKAVSENENSISYLAYRSSSGNTVIIEEYFPASSSRDGETHAVILSNSSSIDKYIDELKISAQLSKFPSIDTITDSFKAGNTVYAVYKNTDKTDMHTYVENCGAKISTDLAFFILRELASALKCVHKAGYTHGGITDRNVYIDGGGKVLLGGFGAERLSTEKNAFMPIESYTGDGEIGPWTDIYSLGAVVYCAVTERTYPDPTKRLNQFEALPISRDGVDKKLYKVLAKCMEVYPKRRFQNIDLLIRAIDEAMTEETPAEVAEPAHKSPTAVTQPAERPYSVIFSKASTESTAAQPTRPNTRNKLIGIIIALILVVALTAGLVMYFIWQNDRDSKNPTLGNVSNSGMAGDDADALFEKGKEHYSQGNYELAFECFSAAAAKGHAESAYEAGMCYFNGIGTEQNSTAAYNHFVLAEKGGNIDASYMLGLFYYFGHVVDTDYEKAAYYLLPAANANNADANYLLGECYFYGYGVSQSYANAFSCYVKAAEKNHGAALYKTAVCYENGLGVNKDIDTAIEYYILAANEENPDALLYIGILLISESSSKEDEALALDYLIRAANAGSVYATYLVGECYMIGFGTEQDTKTALDYLTIAANEGSGEALTKLGQYYISIYDRSKDTDGSIADHALSYLITAYELGYTPALVVIADLYVEGFCALDDLDIAFEYYMIALNENYNAATSEDCITKMRNIAKAYYFGSGTQQDYKKAFDYFMDLADCGDAESMNWVGYFYSKGYGVGQNSNKAFEWYKKSADSGYSLGMHNTAFCYINGIGTEVNTDKALEYFKKSGGSSTADLHGISEKVS